MLEPITRRTPDQQCGHRSLHLHRLPQVVAHRPARAKFMVGGQLLVEPRRPCGCHHRDLYFGSDDFAFDRAFLND